MRSAEREWLDLTAELLANPLLELPQERIARKLAATFDCGGCAFSSVGTYQPVRRIWPADFFGDAREEATRWAAGNSAAMHPILCYYVARGAIEAMQIAEVPLVFGEQWRASGWDGFCRLHDVHHQICVPLQVGPKAHKAFVAGRPTAYTDREMHLACSVQRLLIGLDRQVSVLARRWATAEAPAADKRLTAREVAVIALLADGLTAAAASRRLAISERTVHKHLERIYTKLGVSDRVSAVLRATKLGIVEV